MSPLRGLSQRKSASAFPKIFEDGLNRRHFDRLGDCDITYLSSEFTIDYVGNRETY